MSLKWEHWICCTLSSVGLRTRTSGLRNLQSYVLTPECPPCPGLPGTFLVLAPNALHQGKPLGKWREPIALARRTLGWPPLSSSPQRARHTASCFCICVAKGLFSKPFCLYISFNESAGNPFKSWCDFLLFLQNFPPAISSPVRLPSPVHLLHLRMVFLIVCPR